MQIPIIYEDNHLLIVEKPVNIPVQEDQSKDPDLLNILKVDLKVRYQKPGNVYLGLVHRLDRPVGGVIAFAKTSKCASRLANSLRQNKFDRQYLAIVRGRPQQKQNKLIDFLWKDNHTNTVYVKDSETSGAKKAILEYEVIASQENLSLLRVTLHTGRSHQIRVQLAHAGLPLYGDQKYGSKVNKVGQQIALWANTLALPHPITKEILTFKSALPQAYPWDLFSY